MNTVYKFRRTGNMVSARRKRTLGDVLFQVQMWLVMLLIIGLTVAMIAIAIVKWDAPDYYWGPSDNNNGLHYTLYESRP